jgi:hypothetical protein
MKLITREIELKLKKNMALPEGDRRPVVKFFGGGACTWLISEREGDILFGLCDLGLGCAELGYVALSELEGLRFPPFGLGVERDSSFEPDKTLSAYADDIYCRFCAAWESLRDDCAMHDARNFHHRQCPRDDCLSGYEGAFLSAAGRLLSWVCLVFFGLLL